VSESLLQKPTSPLVKRKGRGESHLLSLSYNLCRLGEGGKSLHVREPKTSYLPICKRWEKKEETNATAGTKVPAVRPPVKFSLEEKRGPGRPRGGSLHLQEEKKKGRRKKPFVHDIAGGKKRRSC